MSAPTLNGETMRRHIDDEILLALKKGDKDSNEIRDEIENRAENPLTVKQGTFYSAMKRLEDQGYISSYRSSSDDGIRRKFFLITDKGNKSLEEKGFVFVYDAADKNASVEEENFPNPPSEIADRSDEFDDLKDLAGLFVGKNDDETVPSDGLIDKLGAETLNYLNSELNDEKLQADNYSEVALSDEIREQKEETRADKREEIIEEEKVNKAFYQYEFEDTANYDAEVKVDDDYSDDERDYKEILNKLFRKDESKTETENSNDEPTETHAFSESEKTFKNKQLNNDFIDFSDLFAMANTEGFKVRASFGAEKRSGDNVLLNKLRFHASALWFLILFAELLILNFSLIDYINWSAGVKFAVLGAFALFPIVCAAIYLSGKDKKVAELAPFKYVFEIALIITFQLLIIVLCVALFVSVDFNSPKEVISYIVMPSVIAINFPIYFALKYALFNTGIYSSAD